MNVRMIPIFLLAFWSVGCLQGTSGPPETEEPVILLRVSGGIAGVDFTLRVDGPRREVTGVECVSGCDFQEGTLFHGLSRQQADYLSNLFRSAGIHALNGTDFGTECCDQFHYDLTYKDSEGASTVRGTAEALPQSLREAIATVAAYVDKVVPVVVALDTDTGWWPRDAVLLTAWGVSGDFAQLQVSYGGGCRSHYFDLVAHGGWRESDPVRVSALLSHDGNGDLCEALLSEELVFDLRPLRDAYQKVYGASEPGTTTLLITLEGVPSPSSLSYIPLEYTF